MLVVSDLPLQHRRLARDRRAPARRRRAAGGREGDLRTGVTGGAATLNTYGAATKARLPLVIGAFVLFTLLALVVDPAGAAAGAADGRPQPRLGGGGDRGDERWSARSPTGYPLGGHPYIDTVGAGAIFGVTFGLSIDYAVFLIARMRERYDVDGDNRAAIALRAGEDRRGDHRRRRDHGRRLRLLRGGADRDREPDGGRADGGDPARRDRGADRPAAGADAAARRPRLARAAGCSTASFRAVTFLVQGRAHPRHDRKTEERKSRGMHAARGIDAALDRRRRARRGAAGAATDAAAAEAPTREEYVDPARAICKPDAEATQQAMKGARADVQRRTADVAAGKFAKATSIFGGTVKEISAVPRPPADAAKLGKWFGYLKAQESYLQPDHRAAAGRPRDQGPAADRPLHPQRQPRQQHRPRLRLRLLQLQVLQVRVRPRRAPGAASRGRSAHWRRWRCSAASAPGWPTASAPSTAT